MWSKLPVSTCSELVMEAWGEPKHPNSFPPYSHSHSVPGGDKEHLGQKGPGVLKAYLKIFVMQQTLQGSAVC